MSWKRHAWNLWLQWYPLLEGRRGNEFGLKSSATSIPKEGITFNRSKESQENLIFVLQATKKILEDKRLTGKTVLFRLQISNARHFESTWCFYVVSWQEWQLKNSVTIFKSSLISSEKRSFYSWPIDSLPPTWPPWCNVRANNSKC